MSIIVFINRMSEFVSFVIVAANWGGFMTTAVCKLKPVTGKLQPTFHILGYIANWRVLFMRIDGFLL